MREAFATAPCADCAAADTRALCGPAQTHSESRRPSTSARTTAAMAATGTVVPARKFSCAGSSAARVASYPSDETKARETSMASLNSSTELISKRVVENAMTGS